MIMNHHYCKLKLINNDDYFIFKDPSFCWKLWNSCNLWKISPSNFQKIFLFCIVSFLEIDLIPYSIQSLWPPIPIKCYNSFLHVKSEGKMWNFDVMSTTENILEASLPLAETEHQAVFLPYLKIIKKLFSDKARFLIFHKIQLLLQNLRTLYMVLTHFWIKWKFKTPPIVLLLLLNVIQKLRKNTNFLHLILQCPRRRKTIVNWCWIFNFKWFACYSESTPETWST